MEEEFYCILKLVSGEEVFSLISIDNTDETNPVIILQNPITMSMVSNKNGMMIKIKPWINLSNEDIFIIRLDKVITMTEVKDQKLIDIYNNYVYEDSLDIPSLSGKVSLSKEMGYISSVEESREHLEKIYKKFKES